MDEEQQQQQPIDIYLVRHAESCSNVLDNNIDKSMSPYEPLLSTTGILQSFMLREYIHSTQITYDNVFSSSLMRTIMTSMITLCSIDTPNTNVIYVIPFLKTIKNDTAQIQVNCVSDLTKKINRFKKWFYNYGNSIYKLFLSIHHRHQNIQSSSSTNMDNKVIQFNFPRVDYQLLQEYENYHSHNKTSSKEQFDEYISHLSSNISSLLVFTHKTFIMEMTHTENEPKNTSITLISLYNDVPIRKFYNPKSLRNYNRHIRKLQRSNNKLDMCNNVPYTAKKQKIRNSKRTQRKKNRFYSV
jgi:hypothetical protein